MPATPPPIASNPIAGTGKASAHPKASDAQERAPHAISSKTPLGGLQRQPHLPAAGAPGSTITLKLWGRARGPGGGAPKRGKGGLGDYSFLQNALSGCPRAAPAWPGLSAPPPSPARPPGAPSPPEPAAGSRSGPGLCPAGLGPRAALTSAGLRSPRACAEPDKWYAMTRGMITLLLLVIIRVNAIYNYGRQHPAPGAAAPAAPSMWLRRALLSFPAPSAGRSRQHPLEAPSPSSSSSSGPRARLP